MEHRTAPLAALAGRAKGAALLRRDPAAALGMTERGRERRGAQEEAQRSAGARRNGAGQRRGEKPERSKPRSDPARRSAQGCRGVVPCEARERSERGESGPRAQRAGLTNPASYKLRY